LQPPDEFQAVHELESAECFADIERLTVAVVVAMIGRCKNCLTRQVSAEQSAREWKANDDHDVFFERTVKEFAGWLLAENVEDDL